MPEEMVLPNVFLAYPSSMEKLLIRVKSTIIVASNRQFTPSERDSLLKSLKELQNITMVFISQLENIRYN